MIENTAKYVYIAKPYFMANKKSIPSKSTDEPNNAERKPGTVLINYNWKRRVQIREKLRNR